MVGHGGSSAGSYLADPTSPTPSHCASIVVTSTLRVKCPQIPCLVSVHKFRFTFCIIACEYVAHTQWLGRSGQCVKKDDLPVGVAMK